MSDSQQDQRPKRKKSLYERIVRYSLMNENERNMALATGPNGNGNFHQFLSFKRINGKWRVRK